VVDELFCSSDYILKGKEREEQERERGESETLKVNPRTFSGCSGKRFEKPGQKKGRKGKGKFSRVREMCGGEERGRI
jgi:hypothetical protein